MVLLAGGGEKRSEGETKTGVGRGFLGFGRSCLMELKHSECQEACLEELEGCMKHEQEL